MSDEEINHKLPAQQIGLVSNHARCHVPVPLLAQVSRRHFEWPRSRRIETKLQVTIVTVLALGVFGYIKGMFTVKRPFQSAWQTMAVGGLAAAAAFTLAKLIG